MGKKKKFKQPEAEIPPVDKLPETEIIQSVQQTAETPKIEQPEHRSFLQRMRDRRGK